MTMHARPEFYRTLPHDGGGHGRVHMAIKFIGGPKPRYTACGLDIDTTRHLGGTLFRAAFEVFCTDCDTILDRFAEAQEVST